MPLFEEYRESLKSEIADMLNSPGRPAGAITAAMFLKEFVGTTPWAHLDIAGTAWAEEARPWTAEGRHRRDDSHAGRGRADRGQELAVNAESFQHTPPQPITPTIIEVVKEPRLRIDMIQVAVAAFGLTGVIMAAAVVAGLLAGRAVHLVPPPPPGIDHRSARRRAQLLQSSQ